MGLHSIFASGPENDGRGVWGGSGAGRGRAWVLVFNIRKRRKDLQVIFCAFKVLVCV